MILVTFVFLFCMLRYCTSVVASVTAFFVVVVHAVVACLVVSFFPKTVGLPCFMFHAAVSIHLKSLSAACCCVN